MFGYFFPKSAIFFDLLDKHVLLTYQAAIKFQESLSEEINMSNLRQIKTLEHEADLIAKQTAEILHKTFITPIDRDQIYNLVSKIDDVIDSIDATADCLIIYKITKATEQLVYMAQVLTWTITEMQKAVNGLRNLKKSESIIIACTAVNKYEHEADEALQSALSKLFQEEPDARQLIIWKEIYESLESATDRCSDVADTIEGILLENN